MPILKASPSSVDLKLNFESAKLDDVSGETGRPPKRARTEQATPLSSEPLSRDEFLYFEDGNVIVVAEKVAFRVHRGQLSRHSEVFVEKLALIQVKGSEKYDGCPVLQLFDGVEPVRHLLKALYDGFWPNSGNSECLRNILVLSTKYRIQTLRETALEVLAMHSPDTMEKFISPCGTLFLNPCYTLLLALETKSRRLLPAAYYNVSCMPHSKVLEGLQGDMNPAWWMSLIKGKAALADWLAVFLNGRLHPCLHQSCSMSTAPCWNKLMETRRFYLAAAVQPSHVTGSILSPHPFLILTRIKERSNTMCPLCQQTMKQYLSLAMQELWTQLPAFFDLESWDKLHN